MHRRLLLLALVLGVLGCGARGEVVKENFTAQVDSLLGEIKVKRKEVEMALDDLRAGIDQLKRGKIEAQVKLNQISEDLSAVEKKMGKADDALRKLRDRLGSQAEEVEIAGTTYTQSELKEMAEKTISIRKQITTEAEALRSSKERLEAVVASLKRQEQDGQDRIRRLEMHLDEIDAKAVALRSIKESSKLADSTKPMDFETVEDQVEELSQKIDVELAFHEEKREELDPSDDLKALDEVVRATNTPSDTISEIDQILGEE